MTDLPSNKNDDRIRMQNKRKQAIDIECARKAHKKQYKNDIRLMAQSVSTDHGDINLEEPLNHSNAEFIAQKDKIVALNAEVVALQAEIISLKKKLANLTPNHHTPAESNSNQQENITSNKRNVLSKSFLIYYNLTIN